ncbi:C-terminal helicase domain-containing protein [Burkholderia cenocepacia]|uniref:C-terminal helicase domain-containing protein n=1 Tax=Burkholderia cenocepacia TaxID=95486 RepID=UPI002AB0B603|nr:helicase-related protein [Burkholderia cenocepacia]
MKQDKEKGMHVISKDPREVHDGYKEAVVDSLLNNLSARLEGKGEFYKIVYGMKPSTALMSGFIVPMPLEERVGDEEADPIRISAHGMDLQVRTTDASEMLSVSVLGAVYVRILPTEDEIKTGGRLEPVFPLNTQARALLRTKVKEALGKLEASLPSGKKHADWRHKSLQVRQQAYTDLGLPFDNKLDRASADQSEPASEVEQDNDLQETEAGTPTPAQAVSASAAIPDGMAEPIAPPAKWLRLELTLPSFDFTPATADTDAKQATALLNAAIQEQLEAWAVSIEEPFGGQLWGYRHGRNILPSDLQNWKKYLEGVRTSKLKPVLPQIELRWVIQVLPDPLDAARTTLHVALENWSNLATKANYKEVEPSLFQLAVTVAVPAKAHQFLHLDRVKPSYRYNRYLKYPALGFNGGVTLSRDGDTNRLTTTWSPRYVLPRIVPISHGVNLNIARLSQPDCLEGLAPLLPAYEKWLEATAKRPVGEGVEGPTAAEQRQAEEAQLQKDILEWKAELGAIRCGLAILEKSREHWSGPGPQKSGLGVPFEAWVSMNAAMAKVAADKGYEDWRLFQLAFILASIPAFATRIPEFHDFYTPEVAKHSNAVTLLYFSTGGGKSEAFLGLLVFVLLLDRLRGKLQGVSALMRYPLRLLTLQQARRTLTAIAAAEQQRYERQHPGEPFSLGFWVGGSNTPNWHTAEGYTDVDTVGDVPPSAEATHRENQPYKSARERWLKLSSCPFCGSRSGSLLALRRKLGAGGNALGHYCNAPKTECPWNTRFSEPTPLPFYIVDEDIYDLAPSVLLGTVDKLSALGQSQGTIRKFFGMFGFAPFVEAATSRLYIPMLGRDWEGLPDVGTKALFPTYPNGEKRFFDPFPSLLIQDEAHLLDESLGTFSGLFESALEAAFDQLAPLYKGHLACEPDSNVRRRIKVIAASATVSEPQRQMRNIYQRTNTVRFPYPGPDLYSSFYAAPKQPDNSSEDEERVSIPESETELRSRWARVYISTLTNAHRHTVAMASVLGHYHLVITDLYERLRSEDADKQESAREELVRWVSPGPLQAQFVRLLKAADPSLLLTLVNLHRIALTYVTNKKGGDQIIDTEKVQFEKLHEAAGINGQVLASELISGAVSAAEIQEIVRRAEKRIGINEEFPDLNDTLRSVIATSAISHGVDVEEFNAMFFAGLPSDIAEYIQASSRVGRTHVGFSLLVPVPQRYRDRFVLEVHDIFHRFLERMILPAAVDRWAEKALVRVMPSFFQEYVCGINVIQALCAADDEVKQRVPSYLMAADARAYMATPANVKATEAFMEKALGLQFMPSPEGKKYYQALLKNQINRYRQDLDVDKYVNATRLVRFFEVRDNRLRPMTSLRDVDQPGFIRESGIDAASKRVAAGATARVMTFIRKGSGADIDVTDPETEAKS